MARVEMADGWEAALQPAISGALEEVAAQIEADAKAIAPVDTGALKASIAHEVRGPVARIGSNLDYALAVEMGFHGVEHVRDYTRTDGVRVRAHERHANQPSEPFLRPALYTQRGA